jgi:hypothetical protein
MKRLACAVGMLCIITLISPEPARADSPMIEFSAIDSVTVTFGRNEGMGALDRIMQGQDADIRRIVDRFNANQSLLISVKSNADGVRYRANHIKNNVVVSEERNVTGSTILELYGADMARVYSTATAVENDTGTVRRYVTIRLMAASVSGLEHGAVADVSEPDTVYVCDTTPHHRIISNAWLGLGLAYVGEEFVPFVFGQLGNDRLRFEAEGGHSLFRHDRTFQEKLKVHYRYVHVGLAWRPWLNHHWDALVGWQRFEAYATAYGRYAEKREGPTFGLRYVYRHLGVTAKYALAEISVRGVDRVDWDHGVYLGVSLFTAVKGGDQ